MGVHTLLKFLSLLVWVDFFSRVTHDYQVVESVIINFEITRLDFSAESGLLIAKEFKILKIHPQLN